MTLQLALALACVALALAYLGRRAWRTWFATGPGCAGGCGCGKQPASAPEGVTFVPLKDLSIRKRGND